MKSKIALFLTSLLFFTQASLYAQSTKEECIKTINYYYELLNDYARYKYEGREYYVKNIAALFYIPDSMEKNIVYIDLRVFDDKPIAEKTNLKAYLDAMGKMINSGKNIKYETTIKENTYTEDEIYIDELKRRAKVSQIEVDKIVYCGDGKAHIIDKVEFVDGKISKIKSHIYIKPESKVKKSIEKFGNDFFEPAEYDLALNIWGTTNLCFGFTMQNDEWSLNDAIRLGFGLEGNAIACMHDDKLDWLPTFLGVIAWDCKYFSLGVNMGVGGYLHDRRTETIWGQEVTISESKASITLLVDPYISITLPIDIDISLRLMAGYNWYFIAGSEWNGLGFGMGLTFDGI